MAGLTIGTKIDHYKYGEGIVSEAGITGYSIAFSKDGEMQFSNLEEDDYNIISSGSGNFNDGGTGLSIGEIEQVLKNILEKYQGLQEEVELGKKWEGGKLLLQPADENLKPYELPIDSFFHKIVMVRDRLRVLEQNINSNKTLTDEEKVNLQQYITRSYGSLTSFNILFKNKEDHFKRSGK